MAEQADAGDLKSPGLNRPVPVQVRPRAPIKDLALDSEAFKGNKSWWTPGFLQDKTRITNFCVHEGVKNLPFYPEDLVGATVKFHYKS